MLQCKTQLLFFLFTWQCPAALLQECNQGAGADSDVIAEDSSGTSSNLMMLQVRSMEKRPEATNGEDFRTLGAGCCSGYRDAVRGKLWADEAADVEACQAKCREFENCGFVEYGWTWNPKWCYIWSDEQPCAFLDTGGYGTCGGGGSDGVETYVFQKNVNFLKNENPQMIMQETVKGESKPKESKPKESKPKESKPKESKLKESKLKESKLKESKPKESKPKIYVLKESKPNESKLKESKPKESKPKESKPKESKPKESKPKESKPKESKPKESKPKESKPKEEQIKNTAADSNASADAGVEAEKNSREVDAATQQNVSKEDADDKAGKKADEATPDDLDFDALGAGCCRGTRDAAHGKLWGSPLPDLSACKAQCRATPNCGFIEYGWSGQSADHKFCFIWSKQQQCSALDLGADKCGSAGSDGVRSYKFKPSLSPQLADIDAPQDFDTVGSGCCPGARETRDGKLWAGSTPNLEACKAKCREHGGMCGAVEYGWNGRSSNHQFCFVWSTQQACASVEQGPGKCGPSGSDGVQAYRMKNQTGMRALDSQDATMLKEEVSEDVLSASWEDVGAGCCKGKRTGILKSVSGAPSLSICKEMCLGHSNCGAVEWAEGDSADGSSTTCVIWGDTEGCLELAMGDGCSAHDAFHSVRTYKLRSRDSDWKWEEPKIVH